MAKRVTVNWRVSPQLRAWIEAHVELGEFPDAGACVEDAIRRFLEMTSPESLDGAIDLAYQSGKPQPVNKRYWDNIRKDAKKFAAAHQRALASRVPILRSWDELDGLIAQAVASGPARPMTRQDWARIRRAATTGAALGKAHRKQRESNS